MILTLQMPVRESPEQIADPTVADGILDRIVHTAHKVEMRGDSMPKERKGETPTEPLLLHNRNTARTVASLDPLHNRLRFPIDHQKETRRAIGGKQ
jgi:hypothetical protein